MKPKNITHSNFEISDRAITNSALTKRELQVIMLLAKGNTDKKVAKTLNISLHTVRTHHKNILHKTGQHNTCGLLLYALKNELIATDLL